MAPSLRSLFFATIRHSRWLKIHAHFRQKSLADPPFLWRARKLGFAPPHLRSCYRSTTPELGDRFIGIPTQKHKPVPVDNRSVDRGYQLKQLPSPLWGEGKGEGVRLGEKDTRSCSPSSCALLPLRGEGRYFKGRRKLKKIPPFTGALHTIISTPSFT